MALADFIEVIVSCLSHYRAHTKYDAKVMFSAFLSFCPQGGGGLNFECLFLQEDLSYLLQILICCRAHPGLSVCQI